MKPERGSAHDPARRPTLDRWKARALAPAFWLVVLLIPLLLAWQLAVDLARKARAALSRR